MAKHNHPVVYATASDGTLLHWTLFPPVGNQSVPVVPVIHVGGWRGGTPGPLNVASDIAQAGFWGAAVEYRLAPPGHLVGQTSIGHYPDQTDDIELMIQAARLLGNGQVYHLGGSAGGGHATATSSLVDKVVLLSAGVDFTVSKDDPKFYHNATNYVGTTDDQALYDASPIRHLLLGMEQPFLAYQTESDPMPRGQWDSLLAKFAELGLTNETHLLTGALHAFEYWDQVKSNVISFLKS